MGSKFEGHALVGYDPAQKQYVSLWIDSTSAVAAKTQGTFDAATKAYTLTGQSVDQAGQPMSIREVLTWKNADTRVLQMEFKGAEQTANMEIEYRRKAKG
jgi:hypothetical protein